MLIFCLKFYHNSYKIRHFKNMGISSESSKIKYIFKVNIFESKGKRIN